MGTTEQQIGDGRVTGHAFEAEFRGGRLSRDWKVLSAGEEKAFNFGRGILLMDGTADRNAAGGTALTFISRATVVGPVCYKEAGLEAVRWQLLRYYFFFGGPMSALLFVATGIESSIWNGTLMILLSFAITVLVGLGSAYKHLPNRPFSMPRAEVVKMATSKAGTGQPLSGSVTGVIASKDDVSLSNTDAPWLTLQEGESATLRSASIDAQRGGGVVHRLAFDGEVTLTGPLTYRVGSVKPWQLRLRKEAWFLALATIGMLVLGVPALLNDGYDKALALGFSGMASAGIAALSFYLMAWKPTKLELESRCIVIEPHVPTPEDKAAEASA